MLKLGLPAEPYWLNLTPDRQNEPVRVKVRPLTTAQYQTAQMYAHVEVKRLLDDAMGLIKAGVAVHNLPDPEDKAALAGLSQAMFAVGLAQSAIIEWQSVGDAEGEPVGPTPDNIRKLMQISFIAERFLADYCRPYEELFSEGNGYTPSPGGTGAGAANTAAGAPKMDLRVVVEDGEPTESAAPTRRTH